MEEEKAQRISLTSREDAEVVDRLCAALGLSRPAVLALAIRVLDSMGHYGVTSLLVRVRDAQVAKVAEEQVADGARWVREQVASDLLRIERRLMELEAKCETK